MIPHGLSSAQLIAAYEKGLEKHSAALIAELRLLLVLPVPSSVTEASVEIFLGEGGNETPTAWIYWSGRNNKVDSSDPTIFPGRSQEISLALTGKAQLDEGYYSDRAVDCVAIVANAAKRWFAECWWKAGGWAYVVPAIVSVHDGFGDGKPRVLSPGH